MTSRWVNGLAGVTALALFLVWIGPAGAAGGPEAVAAAVDAAAANAQAVADKIYQYKELGSQEVKSSALLMEELRKLGFQVTGDLAAPEELVKGGINKTAFKAEMKGQGPGPTLTIMLEYDALPNGHACGHNLIAGSGLLAAAALAKVMPETPGRLVVMGTPDEERGSLGGGKIGLLAGKHFEGSDVVLISHPLDHWSVDTALLASRRATFVFKGKAAHAAAAPEQGINALDAAIMTFNCINATRQHLRQDVRVAGIVTKGGKVSNIVPDLAEIEFTVRALDQPTHEDAYAKVVRCAESSAKAVGATLEFTRPKTGNLAPLYVPAYLDLVRANIKKAGVPDKEVFAGPALGSSDLGHVGHTFPTVNLCFKAAPAGTALHSDAFRDAAGTAEAWQAAATAGRVMALAGYELLTNPEKMKIIKAQFEEIKAKEGK